MKNWNICEEHVQLIEKRARGAAGTGQPGLEFLEVIIINGVPGARSKGINVCLEA